MAQKQEKMGRECNGEEDDAEDAYGERRRVSNCNVNINVFYIQISQNHTHR